LSGFRFETDNVLFAAVTMAETPYLDGMVRLAELNERLAYLQAKDNPRDAEEFVRLYQERRELMKKLSIHSAR
jgi:hypothetical protein